MDQKRKAVIEELADKSLNEISAADFLTALDAGGLSVHSLRLWPEKKKFELWVEPESYGGIKAGELVRVISEKKKVELEKNFPTEDWRFPKRAAREVDLDFRDILRDPDFIKEIAREVALQLGRMR